MTPPEVRLLADVLVKLKIAENDETAVSRAISIIADMRARGYVLEQLAPAEKLKGA